MTTDHSNGSRPVKSAQRTVEVLELLARDQGGSSLASIHEQLGYPKSSLYVLLQTLVGAGWVETDGTGTRYSVGMRALLVGTAYIDGNDLLATARPLLGELRDSTSETVHIAKLDGSDVVYFATYESKHYLRVYSRVGRRQPAYTTSLGKALLAERSDSEVLALLPQKLVAQTPNSITTRADLLRDLAETRIRGYALDNQENTIGLSCVGVALHDGGPPVHAVSCSVPIARLGPGRMEEIAASLRATCQMIDDLTARANTRRRS